MALLNGRPGARLLAWLIAAPLALYPRPAAAQRTAAEDSVKAVFLYNFTKYVGWPVVASNGTSAPLRVCVPANPAFFDLVRAALEGESLDGRPIVAVSPAGLDDAGDCHILYVGDAGSPDAQSWTVAARGRPVLVVGDDVLGAGVVIAFVRDRNRVRFDINRAAAARQGLSVSAKLLRLARRVVD